MISISSLISKDCADIHQSIMDLGYNEWQKNNSWTYSDMLEWVEETYGKEARFAIQIGKYNQQVCNGGHIQYYDNGYASEGAGGCFSTKDNIALHERLVKDFKDFGFHTTEIGSKVFEIMSAFEPEIDDERTVEGDSFDDDPVENEDFGAVVNGAEINKLDEKYFALDEVFITFLEEQFKEFVFNGSFKIVATVAEPVLQVMGV